MSRILVAPIVEGHGDADAVRVLIQKIWTYIGGEHAEILRPNRQPRTRLLQSDQEHLANAINFAATKLTHSSFPGHKAILILLDAEDDCAKHGSLGPLITKRAKEIRNDLDIFCVIANTMYETWFVASMDSLDNYFTLDDNKTKPSDPEGERRGKKWVKQYYKKTYSPSIDQAKLSSGIDVSECRKKSKSFDKFCRELEKRLTMEIGS